MSIFDKSEGNTKAKSKINLTEVSQMKDTAELSLICEQHGEKMEQVGKSERGIPHYYCPRGCKLEVGVGRVKKVFENKGYGFLVTDGEDIFFHFSNLKDTEPVKRGDLLKFRIGYNTVSDRLQAVEVESLNDLRR